jgi:hypothetical protein
MSLAPHFRHPVAVIGIMCANADIPVLSGLFYWMKRRLFPDCHSLGILMRLPATAGQAVLRLDSGNRRRKRGSRL